MTLNLIWSQTPTGVLGPVGDLPWHLPEELARFRSLTAGCPVVLGRATWDALPDDLRPLPGQDTLVLTRDVGWSAPGAIVVHDVEQALALTAGRDTWVVGAGRVYAQLVDVADRVEVTEVDLEVAGDRSAPALWASRWSATAGAWRTSSTGVHYRFASYLRVA